MRQVVETAVTPPQDGRAPYEEMVRVPGGHLPHGLGPALPGGGARAPGDGRRLLDGSLRGTDGEFLLEKLADLANVVVAGGFSCRASCHPLAKLLLSTRYRYGVVIDALGSE